jgi:hypothetical protein
MSKKINKTMQRKIATRAAVEKRRTKKYGSDYLSLSMEDDYYSNVDHFSYEDLSDLLALPQRTSGKI